MGAKGIQGEPNHVLNDITMGHLLPLPWLTSLVLHPELRYTAHISLLREVQA